MELFQVYVSRAIHHKLAKCWSEISDIQDYEEADWFAPGVVGKDWLTWWGRKGHAASNRSDFHELSCVSLVESSEMYSLELDRI